MSLIRKKRKNIFKDLLDPASGSAASEAVYMSNRFSPTHLQI